VSGGGRIRGVDASKGGKPEEPVPTWGEAF
jgi:hypothetical protein